MIYALHGMLGLPSDWKPFFADAHCPGLFDEAPLPFAAWAEKFNRSVDPRAHNILVGYSLGGRLGLHALTQSPQLWQGAVIVSASLKNRPDKWAKDLEWSAKFEKYPWDALMQEWNGQAVFAETFCPERLEEDFKRDILSSVMREWSTAKQKDLTEAVETLPIPVYWLVGERDPTATRTLHFLHPLSKVIVCPHAGHRLQWDNPFFFKHVIEEFQHAIDRPLATP